MANDIQDTIEHQIDELRSQLKHINKSLTDHGIIEELKDTADGALHGVARTARKVARHAQDEATAVAETARENPAATTTALTLVGALGFALGYALAVANEGDRRHRRRWHL